MLHITSHLKNTFKKGVDFIKSITIDTLTAVKNDIVDFNNTRKDFKEFQKSKKTSETSQKSE